MKCPRCNNEKFEEISCGSDSFEDDITWTSYKCIECGLWYSNWKDEWLIDVEFWQDEENAIVFKNKQDNKL